MKKLTDTWKQQKHAQRSHFVRSSSYQAKRGSSVSKKRLGQHAVSSRVPVSSVLLQSGTSDDDPRDLPTPGGRRTSPRLRGQVSEDIKREEGESSKTPTSPANSSFASDIDDEVLKQVEKLEADFQEEQQKRATDGSSSIDNDKSAINVKTFQSNSNSCKSRNGFQPYKSLSSSAIANGNYNDNYSELSNLKSGASNGNFKIRDHDGKGVDNGFHRNGAINASEMGYKGQTFVRSFTSGLSSERKEDSSGEVLCPDSQSPGSEGAVHLQITNDRTMPEDMREDEAGPLDKFQQNSQGFDTTQLSVHGPSTPASVSEQQSVQSPISPPPTQDCLCLSSWGLPDAVLNQYQMMGVEEMFPWQAQCLRKGKALQGGNLIYSAPTSAGKTLVAELLILKKVLESKKKGLIILPFVSVSREKMFYLQNLLQDTAVRVDGFMGSHSPPGGFKNVDVAVCTIEKANSLVNRLLEEKSLDQLGIIVVDELHMVGDSHRGYLLELLLTKIKYVTSSNETNSSPVQIVGMSATLPNLDLLAKWLDADLYSTDFRPVPLTEFVKMGPALYDSQMSHVKDCNLNYDVRHDDEQIFSLSLETMASGCAVLIFCPTKNWCEKLAENMAKELCRLRGVIPIKSTGFVKASEFLTLNINHELLQDILEQLKRTPAGLDGTLKRTIPCAVAYHHAGLTFDERDIIEGGFRQGHIRILIATSTLSSGVNLPARRVIIRTIMFNRRVIDPLCYRQMSGRAGRKGVDTEGESILIVKPNEREKAKALISSELPPVKSCLIQREGEELSNSMKRAILEVIASGVATSPADVQRYSSSTLLAASLPTVDGDDKCDGSGTSSAIDACINFLTEQEFIRLQKDDSGESYLPTQLGSATLASALSPHEAQAVFTELQRARKSFVLENELHILYQVTPIYDNIQPDWYQFLHFWESLSTDRRRVAELVGVEERFLIRAAKGNIPTHTARQMHILGVHRRFHTALILEELVNETPLGQVARKYGCTKGQLQSLQQSASTFAGMVTIFCSKLGWYNLELLLAQFQSRLNFGVQRELVDLVRISLLNAQRARLLYNSGFTNTTMLATASPKEVETILRTAVPFKSVRQAVDEKEFEAAERRAARCIWASGKKGLTEAEAAELIVMEAKYIVQSELGSVGIEWNPQGTKKRKVDPASPSTLGENDRKDKDINDGSTSKEMDKQNVNSYPSTTKSVTCGVQGGNQVNENMTTLKNIAVEKRTEQGPLAGHPHKTDDERRLLLERINNAQEETKLTSTKTSFAEGSDKTTGGQETREDTRNLRSGKRNMKERLEPEDMLPRKNSGLKRKGAVTTEGPNFNTRHTGQGPKERCDKRDRARDVENEIILAVQKEDKEPTNISKVKNVEKQGLTCLVKKVSTRQSCDTHIIESSRESEGMVVTDVQDDQVPDVETKRLTKDLLKADPGHHFENHRPRKEFIKANKRLEDRTIEASKQGEGLCEKEFSSIKSSEVHESKTSKGQFIKFSNKGSVDCKHVDNVPQEKETCTVVNNQIQRNGFIAVERSGINQGQSKMGQFVASKGKKGKGEIENDCGRGCDAEPPKNSVTLTKRNFRSENSCHREDTTIRDSVGQEQKGGGYPKKCFQSKRIEERELCVLGDQAPAKGSAKKGTKSSGDEKGDCLNVEFVSRANIELSKDESVESSSNSQNDAVSAPKNKNQAKVPKGISPELKVPHLFVKSDKNCKISPAGTSPQEMDEHEATLVEGSPDLFLCSPEDGKSILMEEACEKKETCSHGDDAGNSSDQQEYSLLFSPVDSCLEDFLDNYDSQQEMIAVSASPELGQAKKNERHASREKGSKLGLINSEEDVSGPRSGQTKKTNHCGANSFRVSKVGMALAEGEVGTIKSDRGYQENDTTVNSFKKYSNPVLEHSGSERNPTGSRNKQSFQKYCFPESREVGGSSEAHLFQKHSNSEAEANGQVPGRREMEQKTNENVGGCNTRPYSENSRQQNGCKDFGPINNQHHPKPFKLSEHLETETKLELRNCHKLTIDDDVNDNDKVDVNSNPSTNGEDILESSRDCLSPGTLALLDFLADGEGEDETFTAIKPNNGGGSPDLFSEDPDLELLETEVVKDNHEVGADLIKSFVTKESLGDTAKSDEAGGWKLKATLKGCNAKDDIGPCAKGFISAKGSKDVGTFCNTSSQFGQNRRKRKSGEKSLQGDNTRPKQRKSSGQSGHTRNTHSTRRTPFGLSNISKKSPRVPLKLKTPVKMKTPLAFLGSGGERSSSRRSNPRYRRKSNLSFSNSRIPTNLDDSETLSSDYENELDIALDSEELGLALDSQGRDIDMDSEGPDNEASQIEPSMRCYVSKGKRQEDAMGYLICDIDSSKPNSQPASPIAGATQHQMSIMESPPSPCTPNTFAIIDVCANKVLFETFIAEWKTKKRYAFCLGCENYEIPIEGGGIGGNFRKGKTSHSVKVDGFPIEKHNLLVTGLAVSWGTKDAYYISLQNENDKADLDGTLAAPPNDNSIPVNKRVEELTSVLELSVVKKRSQRSSVTKVAFDIKEQIKLLAQVFGCVCLEPIEDPKVAHWLLDPSAKEKNLHGMVAQYTSDQSGILDSIGGGIGLSSLGLSPRNPGSARVRACAESVVLLDLMDSLKKELMDNNAMKAFTEIEMPSIMTLAHVEMNGFGFNPEECETQKVFMQSTLTALEEQAYRLAGRSFSLTSPEDIAQVLFLELQIPPNGDVTGASNQGRVTLQTRKTLGGRGRGRMPKQLSTSKESLEKIKHLHPLPGLILEWRKMSMSLTKVVFPLQKEKVFIKKLQMDRILTDYQTHTATGRVATIEPNIQAIPKDFEISLPSVIGESPPQGIGSIAIGPGTSSRKGGPKRNPRRASVQCKMNLDEINSGREELKTAVSLRHAFCPFPDSVLLAADYSQLELRILAHLSKDSKLTRILNSDGDVFRQIAAQWKGIEEIQITDKQRQEAKQICYGMVYGIGARALGDQLEISEEDAACFMETFRGQYKGMKSYIKETVTKCRETGYVQTISGRKRYLPSINHSNVGARNHAERQAVNTTIQGSAADLVKTAMVRLQREFAATFPSTKVSHTHMDKSCLEADSRRRTRRSQPPQGSPRGAYLVLQLHDELIYEVHQKDLNTAVQLVRTVMESAMKLTVRLPVKIKIGPTWGSLKEL